METAVAVIGTGVIFIIKEVVKTVKYKREKNSIKKNLLKAFADKDKSKIKKYVGYVKDFDSKYRTDKSNKYLDKVIRKDTELNEENVKSLLDSYCMIDNLYDSQNVNVVRQHIENRLDEKIGQLEQKRKETIIRENLMKQKLSQKAMKINKNKGKKSGGMG